MKFVLEMNMDGDALSGDGNGREMARILRRLADLVGEDQLTVGDGWKVLDVNGNTVGRWAVKRSRPVDHR
jgi:uncharacterized hydantoinase/oxoprolinase family protein